MNRLPGSLALVRRFALPGSKLFTPARNVAFWVLGCLAVLGIPAVAQTATTTLGITSNGSAATTVPFGTVVTLTATVAAGATPVSPGQVQFCDATAAHCEDVHIVGTAQLNSAGKAVIKIRPGAGSHSYNAVFLGTPKSSTPRAASTSSNAALTVTAPAQNPSTTVMTVGGSTGTYQLSASVSGIGALPPTGSVSFLDTSNANALLGTASLGSPSSSDQDSPTSPIRPPGWTPVRHRCGRLQWRWHPRHGRCERGHRQQRWYAHHPARKRRWNIHPDVVEPGNRT